MAEDKKGKGDKADAGADRKLPFLENKVVVLGAVVALQLILAVGLTTLVIAPRLGAGQASAGGESAAAAPGKQEVGVLMSLGEIIVTLRAENNQTPRYLRIAVDLEMANQSAVLAAQARLPILRDTVIMTLADRTAAELSRPEGMKGLRDELMRRLSERLPGDILRHIYFSDLVIQ
jgi:flagellar FliL protein